MIIESPVLIVEDEERASLPALAIGESIHYQSDELLPEPGIVRGMIIRNRERRIDDAQGREAVFNAISDEVNYRRETMNGVLSSKFVPKREKREITEIAFPGKIATRNLWIWRIFKCVIEGIGHKPRERRE